MYLVCSAWVWANFVDFSNGLIDTKVKNGFEPQKYTNRDFLTAAVQACDKSHQIVACWNENCYFYKLCMLQANYFQIYQ